MLDIKNGKEPVFLSYLMPLKTAKIEDNEGEENMEPHNIMPAFDERAILVEASPK